jgi:uncharacterized protein (TIGR02246 family)
MKADARTQAAILAALNQFAASYARGDAQGVLALYADDPDGIVFVGGYRFVGPEQIRTMVEDDLASFEAIEWSFAQPVVSFTGAVAWLTADATATGRTRGLPVPLGAYRLTWVLQRRGEQWLIVHAHVSLATSET